MIVGEPDGGLRFANPPYGLTGIATPNLDTVLAQQQGHLGKVLMSARIPAARIQS
jgi:hypothetical protein